jgi:uncharacterized membrane protein
MKRLRIAGHSIHPVTTIFPASLLATSLVFNTLGILTRDDEQLAIAHWCAGAMVVSGLAAGLLGFLDWLAIPARAPGKGPGLRHAMASTLSLSLVAASWFLGQGGRVPPLITLALSAFAAAAMFVAFRLGERAAVPRAVDGAQAPVAPGVAPFSSRSR